MRRAGLTAEIPPRNHHVEDAEVTRTIRVVDGIGRHELEGLLAAGFVQVSAVVG